MMTIIVGQYRFKFRWPQSCWLTWTNSREENRIIFCPISQREFERELHCPRTQTQPHTHNAKRRQVRETHCVSSTCGGATVNGNLHSTFVCTNRPCKFGCPRAQAGTQFACSSPPTHWPHCPAMIAIANVANPTSSHGFQITGWRRDSRPKLAHANHDLYIRFDLEASLWIQVMLAQRKISSLLIKI